MGSSSWEGGPFRMILDPPTLGIPYLPTAFRAETKAATGGIGSIGRCYQVAM